MHRIEVITSKQKRRRYTAEGKTRFVTLSMHPVIQSRWFGITLSQLFK